MKFGSWLAVALLLTGCAAITPELPEAFSTIRFEIVSSPTVEVLAPRFRTGDHGVYLDGSVRRAFGASSTADSGLQLTFFSGDGAVLSVQLVEFFPAELPRRSSHPYNEGHYRVPMPQLAGGTSRIEVRAVPKRNP